MILLVFLILKVSIVLGENCQAPGQGHLELRIKETFHANLAETELKEWMIHPNNFEIRENLKSLDRRIKFTPQRLDRELMQAESQRIFEHAILNTGRPSVMENFPAIGTVSKISASERALSLEMSNLPKEELDFIPKEVLGKLESKVKVNYHYPYDKFEYLLTYEGKELPMENALLKVQKAMEEACELRRIDNGNYRNWNEKIHGIRGTSGAGASQ